MTWDTAEVVREASGRVGNMCQRVSPVTALSVFLHSQPWAPGGPAGLKPLLLWPRPRLSLSLSLSPLLPPSGKSCLPPQVPLIMSLPFSAPFTVVCLWG